MTIATAVGDITRCRTTFFIATEEDNIDIKAEILDAPGNILNTIQVPNVPFKRNRATFLTGKCYSASSSASFSAESAFLTDYHINF